MSTRMELLTLTQKRYSRLKGFESVKFAISDTRFCDRDGIPTSGVAVTLHRGDTSTRISVDTLSRCIEAVRQQLVTDAAIESERYIWPFDTKRATRIVVALPANELIRMCDRFGIYVAEMPAWKDERYVGRIIMPSAAAPIVRDYLARNNVWHIG